MLKIFVTEIFLKFVFLYDKKMYLSSFEMNFIY